MDRGLTEFLIGRAPWLLLLASVVVLGSALGSQYIGGLQPCVLCLYQRWPYVAVIVLCAGALALRGRDMAGAALIGVGGLALLAGAGIAAFHVGVEQHWWQGTPACGGGVELSRGSVDELRERLLAAPVVRCDQVAWSLFGISMAGYNLAVSLALGAAALYAAARLTGRRRS